MAEYSLDPEVNPQGKTKEIDKIFKTLVKNAGKTEAELTTSEHGNFWARAEEIFGRRAGKIGTEQLASGNTAGKMLGTLGRMK